MQPLVRVIAFKELLEDSKFTVLLQESFQSFPPEIFAGLLTNNMITQVDPQIGFVSTPSFIKQSLDERGILQHFLRQIDHRLPYLNEAIEREKMNHRVNDVFVAALKVKTAMSLLMQFSDFYIGY